MNRSDSLPNHENRTLYDGPPLPWPFRGPAAREFFFTDPMNRVLTIPASKLNTTIHYENPITFSSCMGVSQGESCLFSWEMFLKNLNAHGSFTPAASVPLNVIPPEQELYHHRFLRAGVAWGDRNCPVLCPT